MKRKILSFVFALCLIIPASIFMSACGNNSCQHNFSEWVTKTPASCTTNEIEKRTCSGCGVEETRTGDEAGHDYGEIVHNYAEQLQTCVTCGDVKSNINATYETDGNGWVKPVYVSDERFVLRPMPNAGYYFLKWEVTDSFNNTYYTTTSIEVSSNSTHSYYSGYNYKAIFTNDSSQILPINVDIEVENDLDVNVEYLPYVTKDEYQTFSYFVHPNENLVLSGDSSYVASLNSYGNEILHTTEDDVRLLPTSSAYAHFSFIDENHYLDTIYLKFADIRGKCIVTLDDININGEEVNFICNKNEEVTINTKEFGRNIFQYWGDEDQNVISTNEEFKLNVTKNTTIYLYSKEYDIIYNTIGELQEGNRQFFFEINQDNTLTLHRFSGGQYEDIEIPSEIQGMAVSGIGMLHLENYGGTLTIPNSIVNFDSNAFKYVGGTGGIATIKFKSDRTDLLASDFYNCSDRVLFDFSETTLEKWLIMNYIN